MQRQLKYQDAKSDKFWNIEVKGKSFTVTYGRTGTAGVSQMKTFSSPATCLNEAEKLVNQKLKKGYVEQGITESQHKLAVIMERCIKNGDFPFFDHARKISGLMRVTGFTWKGNAALVFEQIAINGSGDIENSVYVFGEHMKNELVQTVFLATGETFFENVDSSTIKSKVTGVVYNPSSEKYFNKSAAIEKSFSFKINKKKITLPVELPDLKGVKFKGIKKQKYLSPAEMLFFQLCDTNANILFLPDKELRSIATIPGQAKDLFSFTTWQHPDALHAELTTDIVAMAQALETRTAIQSLPGKPNTNFRYWLDCFIELRSEKDWGWGK